MNILVVDDHPLYIDGLKQVLSQIEGQAEVVQAVSAEQALELIESGDSVFDLLLVDLNMPGIDGLDLLMTLDERELWIPSVMISAQDNAQVIMQALDAGALGFIPKSFGASELLDALHTVFQGKVFLPKGMDQQIERLRRAVDGKRPVEKAAEDFGITPRQYRVLELMAKGYSNKKVAMTLYLTEHTVKSHVSQLFMALDVDNRTACVQRAVQLGLVQKAAASVE